MREKGINIMMVFIALVVAVITGSIIFLSSSFYKKILFLPFIMVIIAIFVMYRIGMWIGNRVDIKKEPDMIWLGLLIGIGNLIFAVIGFPLYAFTFEVGLEWGEGMIYASVDIFYMICSAILILQHIIKLYSWHKYNK